MNLKSHLMICKIWIKQVFRDFGEAVCEAPAKNASDGASPHTD